MITKQLWSKCRIIIVFPKLVKIEIQSFMGWKALAILMIILSFWRFVEADFKIDSVTFTFIKILDRQIKQKISDYS